MKKETLIIQPKKTRRKMSEEELARHLDITRKSAHVHKSKKKYNRKRDRKVDY